MAKNSKDFQYVLEEVLEGIGSRYVVVPPLESAQWFDTLEKAEEYALDGYFIAEITITNVRQKSLKTSYKEIK